MPDMIHNESLSVSVMILAGGQGKRMGYQDKGQIPFKGKPLIETVVDQLHQQLLNNIHELNIVISTNSPENYLSLGFPCIDDSPFPSEGPLCAIAAGMQKIKTDYLLIVPCDCPSIPDDLLTILLNALQSHDSYIASILSSKGIEPLFSLIRTNNKSSVDNELATQLSDKIAKGLRKAQNWIRSEKHVLVEDLRDAYYININKPEDLIKLQNDKT